MGYSTWLDEQKTMPLSALTSSIYAALLMVGVVQCIFFVVMLLTVKKGHQLANMLLASLMLVFALDLVDEYFLFTKFSLNYAKLHLVNGVIDFLFGPLFYLYAVTLTEQNRSLKRSLMHVTPFFLAAVVAVILGWQFTDAEVADVIHFNGGEGWLAGILFVIDLLATVSMLTYLILSSLHLRRHQKHIGDFYSYQKKVNLKWLSMILKGLIVLFTVYIMVPFFSNESTVYQSNFVFYLLLISMIHVVGYSGLKQPQLFITKTNRQVHDTGTAEPDKAVALINKYHNSALTRLQAEAVIDDLDETMHKQLLYLDDDLTLDDLASHSGIARNWVSQAINEVMGINFYDYVNGFRVEEAKRLLKDQRHKHKKIIEIAYESGFKAKSSFNLSFKKACGMTPSQYRMQFKRPNG